MADASTYYPDIIRALVEHPTPAGAAFLVKGSEHPDAAEAARLKQTSCDVRASVVCARAWFGDSHGGYRLSRDFYTGDRAMRESGFDTSDRFGPFSGATHHYAPVCLNSLLYRYERDLAHSRICSASRRTRYIGTAAPMLAPLRCSATCGNQRQGVFADYDFTRGKPSSYAFITSLYPLWAGVATREQANAMEAKLNLFERPGGLSTSNTQYRPAMG